MKAAINIGPPPRKIQMATPRKQRHWWRMILRCITSPKEQWQ